MVRVLIDERVGARVRIKGMGANEVRAGEIVPEVAINGVDKKELAMLIPIVAPRIGGAGTNGLDNFSHWMITPNRPAQRNALLRWGAGLSHFTCTGGAAAAVKPAVGAESQAVRKGMVHVRGAGEAVQDNFGRAVRHTVMIAVGDK